MKKTEYSGMYKVAEGIVVNKDNDALITYKKKKMKDYQTATEINNMKQKIDKLNDDISEIKILLRSLVK